MMIYYPLSSLQYHRVFIGTVIWFTAQKMKFSIKACVFSSNDSPSKTMKNAFYLSSFRSRDIQFFYFCSFLPVGHCFRGSSKLNLKTHDVINCLNKNSITHFVRYLEKEKGMALKLCPEMEYQIKNIFMEKSCRKYATNASPRALYNFGK